MVLAASDDRFNQELVGWFALHEGPWSGTASELLGALKTRAGVENDLWPQSLPALYSHIESHRQILRSLGVDALLHHGRPRMISLRSCPDEKPTRESSSGISATAPSSDPPISLPALAYNQGKESTDADQASPTGDEARTQDIPPVKSDVKDVRLANGVSAGSNNFEEGIFKSTGEALFALVEMRMQIREHGLPPESAIGLVVGRTEEITWSCGVAVGLLRQNSIVYPSRTGVAATAGALQFQPNLFQTCLRMGRTLQLRDAQNHPRVGAACRREGIGSLIIVLLFHNREVAGAIEFLFKEKRSFSIGDVMDLELIAGVISGSLSGIEQMKLKQAEGRECLDKTEPTENIAPQVGDSLIEKAGLVHVMASSCPDTAAQTSLTASAAPESMVFGSLTSNLATPPSLLWLAFKRVWMKCARVMRIRSTECL